MVEDHSFWHVSEFKTVLCRGLRLAFQKFQVAFLKVEQTRTESIHKELDKYSVLLSHIALYVQRWKQQRYEKALCAASKNNQFLVYWENKNTLDMYLPGLIVSFIKEKNVIN